MAGYHKKFRRKVSGKVGIKFLNEVPSKNFTRKFWSNKNFKNFLGKIWVENRRKNFSENYSRSGETPQIIFEEMFTKFPSKFLRKIFHVVKKISKKLSTGSRRKFHSKKFHEVTSFAKLSRMKFQWKKFHASAEKIREDMRPKFLQKISTRSHLAKTFWKKNGR